ncbi:monoacylglycerol lipase [Bacillus sp. FJAT-27231]|uniref:alpha/beta hydrolase n=1 Tax=Bacillus sp. FJAT-27231 TaxID=1679168 RepID=UPI0006711F5E|nr:alpha/beta fold hydrolase [Bacillus sp. FJAT-27231]KMY52911.1 monoacylglycerol lipase [Bacillus sp. FJAT-27231]
MKEQFAVIPGAESFYFEGNDIGILLSHGFIGTPQSVHFLGEKLAKQGFTVLAPRLKGHGTHYLDMEQCTHEDWYQSLKQGYWQLKKRGKRVFVMGQSMGGTLALKLAAEYKDIEGIITINAALSLPAVEYLREERAPRFIKEGAPDIKAENVHEITYEKAPVRAIRELQELMAEAPALIHNIQVPALCIKSFTDHVVPPENTVFIYRALASKNKRLVTLPNSYHVASMDHDKELIVEQAARFISSYAAVHDYVAIK